MTARALVAAIVLMALPAMAQPFSQSLPFGLSQINLTMSSKELTDRISGSAYETVDPELHLTTLDTLFFTPYRWRDCAFDIRGYFAQDRLVRLELSMMSSQGACRSEVRAELQRQYGGGRFNFVRKFGTSILWSDATATVSYGDTDPNNDPKNEALARVSIGFIQKGGAPLRMSNPAASILAKLGPPPETTGPFQTPAQYVAAALDTTIDGEAYVMITTMDDRTAEANTFCITSNLLIGALVREHGWGIERSREEAASNPTHLFHFSKDEALRNMPDSQRSAKACELIAQGHFVRNSWGNARIADFP
jgi:hypothetical protein